MRRCPRSSGRPPHKLVEIGNGIEPVQDGGLYVELISAAFLRRIA